jgi:hypothetical protein
LFPELTNSTSEGLADGFSLWRAGGRNGVFKQRQHTLRRSALQSRQLLEEAEDLAVAPLIADRQHVPLEPGDSSQLHVNFPVNEMSRVFRLSNDSSIEAPVLNRLRQMCGADRVAPREVGDGAGYLEDTIERAGGEAQPLEGTVEEGAAGRIDGAEAAELLGAHGGVVRRRRAGPEALELEGASGGDAAGHRLRALARRGAQLLQADRRHLDVQVDAVEERPRDASAIALDERGRTAADVSRISQMATRAYLRSLSAMSPYEDGNLAPAIPTLPLPSASTSRNGGLTSNCDSGTWPSCSG